MNIHVKTRAHTRRTLDAMLKHISMYHKDLDYVIWSGDIPAHDVWVSSDVAVLFIYFASHST